MTQKSNTIGTGELCIDRKTGGKSTLIDRFFGDATLSLQKPLTKEI